MFESNIPAGFFFSLLNAAACCSAFPQGPLQGDSMKLASPAFEDGGAIPPVYGYRRGNASPPLEWCLPPSGTRSFALLMEDPDARGWVHWLIWNIPVTAIGLPEGVSPSGQLPDGTRQGLNDFGKIGYGGPCPPSGTHRYCFRLIALDTVLDAGPGAERYDLMKAVDSHVLEEARLTGTYGSCP